MFSSSFMIKGSFLVLTVVMSGCVVGPEYRTPHVETPPTWRAETATGTKKRSVEAKQLAEWWKTLDDPLLSRLVEEATANNLDLKQAQARLRESRARRGFSEVDRLPSVSAGAGVGHNRSSAETGTGSSRTSGTYSARFDAGWEPDLFGGKKRALEASSASLEASQENVRDVQVSLLAEVVLTYIEICACQAQIENTRATIITLEESAQIVVWRNQAGLVSQLDVEQSQLTLEQTRAQLPLLLNKQKQAENNLALLLNRPDSRVSEMNRSEALPTVKTEIAVNIPADILRRRPDIRRAERQLAAATAQIGEAEAKRYPDLSISGTLGLQSAALGNLLNPTAFMYSLAVNSVMTVFDGGRLKQKVEIQNALQEQALITYQSTVRSALRDVENALVAYAEEQNRGRLLKNAVQSAQNATKLSTIQYSSGLVDYSTVVESQKSLLSNKYQLIRSEADVISNLARLYKALGGGWTPDSIDTAATRTAYSGEKQ